MASEVTTSQNGHTKKQILLNAFDMSTVGHLSPGQWKVGYLALLLRMGNPNMDDRIQTIAQLTSGI